MPRQCDGTLCGIVKCRTSSTATALIAVREVKPFKVGRERAMFREENNTLSNPVSGLNSLLSKRGRKVCPFGEDTASPTGGPCPPDTPLAPPLKQRQILHGISRLKPKPMIIEGDENRGITVLPQCNSFCG
ncbi:hypothetical protein AVEN_253198-1 [Araneus ventricosus]|uniref:Uncharacterized protein n=1 Tax=Araneus ventricosus TaxID=182803 RepID=A0A4Y2PQB3_ARAVE|nr:hypothetical protein AVEN_253198-1 [Araneus ventricosus]